MRQQQRKKPTEDFRTLPPERRPAIGEKVTVISGPLVGREGIVAGMLPANRVSVELSLFGRFQRVRLGRETLMDEDGKLMPKYYTEEQKQEHREQYNRLESAMGEEHLHDYLKYKMGIHSDTREKLRNGEAAINDYFDEDICEGLGIGIGWILYGDENCKDYPCGSQIKKYLDKHPEKREQIWKWMQEDGCEVQDIFHDCEEDDWDEEDEIEEYEGSSGNCGREKALRP